MARKAGYCTLICVLFMVFLLPHACAAQDTVTFNGTYDFNYGYESGSTVVSLDDGYLVCASGYATEYNGWWSLKLLRTDLNGNELWRKVYGQEKYGFRNSWYGGMIKVEGGYCLAAGILDSGNVDGKGVLYLFDEYGDTLWTRVYDKPGFSYFHSVRQTLDKGYIIIGNQNISGTRHYWLMKTDSMGIAVWDTTLGIGYATTIEITQDGGYLIGGAGGAALSSARIVKTDNMGNIEWSRNHFAGNQQGCYWSAGVASDGGYYIWGCSDTVINPTDFFLVAVLSKLDSAGNKVWTNFFNNANGKLIMIYQAKELPDGKVIVTGERDDIDPMLASGGWVAKMESGGSVIWDKIHASTQDSTIIIGPNVANDFNLTQDGGIIITGYGYNDIDPGPNFNTNQDIWLLKLDSLGNWYDPFDTTCPPPCDTVGITETTNLQAKLYPNPTTGTLTIELPGGQGGSMALYNLLGQSVYQATLAGGQTTLTLNLPPGLYLYRISSGGKAVNGKLLVE